MRTYLLLLLSLIVGSAAVNASDMPPTPRITLDSPARSELIGYTGETLTFSSSTSSANCGTINQRRWRLDSGSYVYATNFTYTFTLPAGVYEKTYTLELFTRNTCNLYKTETKTITIRRDKRVYFVKDHLGSVRATVNEAGDVIGHDDYYPFGLTMPGRSANTANPNDNYKFTGHERDDEAGINLMYAGARYSDPVLGGRWLSIDPLAAKYPSLSPYNYVANNPINALDPDGRDIWFVHGTFSSPNTWSRDGIDYDARWANALNDRNAGRFNWRWNSKINTVGSRKRAAKKLAKQIAKDYEKNPEMLVQLVAHSHGGNVAIEAANILYEKYNIDVDRLILLATPSREDFTINEGAVKEVYNFSHINDAVQILGGFDTPVGNILKVGMSPAKRARPENENAIEVRVISDDGVIESHSVHTKEELIEWISTQLGGDKLREKH